MADLLFDVRAKDLAGRIGRLELDGVSVETPLLMPVFNIGSPTVSVDELRDLFDVRVLMTNSYMLLKDEVLKEKVLKDGIHETLGFDGLIATDSGSYQLMNYGYVETSNKEIIRFQEDIGSDIASFLDIPSVPDTFKPRAKTQLEETLKRSVEAQEAKFLVNAGVQGGKYLDLRKKAAESIGARFPLVAVGGIVPLMSSYRFSELVDILATVRQNMPADRVVHAFGLGHPMLFSLAVALGCDLFDSASYALFAKDDRYLTVEGTIKLGDMRYNSCTCPVCTEHGMRIKNLVGDDRVHALALHNLHVCFAEMRAVKQSIMSGRLFEHVAKRCRAHPEMMRALETMVKHAGWISGLDMVTKKSAMFYTGAEMNGRPEVLNAKKRLERVESDRLIPLMPFGEVPVELLDIYPFNQCIHPENKGEYSYKVSDLDKLRAIADYQFGSGAGGLIPDNVRVKKSRKTRRIRYVYHKKNLYFTVRASDHFILPKTLYADDLMEGLKAPRLRVVLADDPAVVDCVEDGKSVFAKFVESVDPDLRAGDECLVVDKNDDLIRVGTMHLSPGEIRDFSHGMAVRVR